MAKEKKTKPKKAKKPEKAEKLKETPEKAKPAKEKAKEENRVLIGRKPVMNYVVACITFFNSGEKEVVVKARGRAISRAVDTVELLRRAFVKDLEIKGITLGTQELQGQEGGTRNISTMEITVVKAGSK
jgi:DNA-binding protein